MVDEMFEAALWYNADIPEERDTAKSGIEEIFLRTGTLYAKRFAPIEFEDLAPDDSRLPTPPAYMKGNPKCLYGAARVIGKLEKDPGIINDLTEEDIRKLRIVTRRAFIRAGGHPLTDEECDEFINEHGLEVIKEELMG